MFILQLSWDLFSLARPTLAIEKSSQPQKKADQLNCSQKKHLQEWKNTEARSNFTISVKLQKKIYNTSILSIIEASVTAACKF